MLVRQNYETVDKYQYDHELLTFLKNRFKYLCIISVKDFLSQKITVNKETLFHYLKISQTVLMKRLKKNKVDFALFLDLSKTFDTIDRPLLLSKFNKHVSWAPLKKMFRRLLHEQVPDGSKWKQCQWKSQRRFQRTAG